MRLFLLLTITIVLTISSLAVAEEKSTGMTLGLKDWIEIVSKLGTGLGVLAAAILAWYRWGPHAGPPLMVRQLILIPPGTQADITSENVVIAADLLFTNPSPISEYLTDLTLKIIAPDGKVYYYSPFIYADPSAFFEPAKTPKWVQGLFHPIHIPGSDQKQLTQEMNKCLVFFPDLNTLSFAPVVGRYQVDFLLRRYSLLPWRRERVESKSFEMDTDMVVSLTPGPKASKVGLIEWHFTHSLPE
jgi:hypothetical protein